MPVRESREGALDALLPSYHYAEVHERTVQADPTVCDRAFRELPGSDVRLLGVLLGIRQLPKRLRGRGDRADLGHTPRPLLDDFLEYGFTVLVDDPGERVAAGAIGRWWSPSGNDPVAGIPDAAAFRAFDAPGYAKAAIGFDFPPQSPGTKIRTETRIACTDPAARRLFGAYWALIRVPSGLIRRSWLTAIERRAVASGS